MSSDESRPSKSSPLVAIFALLALGGLLIVPFTFIFYGAGGALGGLVLLAILISCQSVVYVIMKNLWKELG
jgi:hypothetical protein